MLFFNEYPNPVSIYTYNNLCNPNFSVGNWVQGGSDFNESK